MKKKLPLHPLFFILSSFLPLFVILSLAQMVSAAPWQTLPPDHWTYEEIRWLQAGGYLRELNPAALPYRRGEIAAALASGEKPLAGIALRRYQLLEREFTAEMPSQKSWRTQFEGRLFAGYQGQRGEQGREAGYVVLGGSIGSSNLGVHTDLRLDRDLAEDPSYTGKVWNDVAGLTEAAYAVAIGKRWELKIGRDHLYWGPGDDHLLLNFAPRGLDQVQFKAHWRWGAFTGFFGQISDWADSTQQRNRRYLSGHRLDLIPCRWLRLGFSETLLYDGSPRLGMMNPLLPYYLELVSENSAGNGLLGFDFRCYPTSKTELYGELLLDDFQIERKTSKDLEPAEWGWLIGGRWAGLAGRLGISAFYEGVTNRTYNAIEPQHRYLNYGLPLGAKLGNDADRLNVEVSCWISAPFRLDVFYQMLRQGEGRVTAPFDTSYMTYSLDEGYSEPFPTGIVEKTSTLGFGFSFLPDLRLQAEGWIGYDIVDNVSNLANSKAEGWRGRVVVNIIINSVLD